MNNIILDTGFWRAIFTNGDRYYDTAKQISDKYVDKSPYKILVPYPTMYELLRTEYVADKSATEAIEMLLKKECFEMVCDVSYRDLALKLTLSDKKRNLSIVDNILRLMIADTNLNVKGIVTFNVRDFADICRLKGILLINSATY